MTNLFNDHERFAEVKQPVYLRDNVYAGGATPYESERGPSVLNDDVAVVVVEDGDRVFLETTFPVAFDDVRLAVTGGADLPPVRFVDAEFEEPDGSPAVLVTDLIGTVKDPRACHPAGPLGALRSGTHRTRVW